MSSESKLPSAHLFGAMRLLLTLLFVPVCLVALYALIVGVTFGFNLWNPEDPIVTIVWLVIVASPAWFYGLLVWSERSERRTVVFFGLTSAALLTGIAHYVTH